MNILADCFRKKNTYTIKYIIVKTETDMHGYTNQYQEAEGP